MRELAERQHGVVARRQLFELGIGTSTVQRRCEGGLLIPVIRRPGGALHAGIRLHQTRSLRSHDTTTEAGIPVTSIERTLLDLAARLDDKQLERMLVAADRSGRLSWVELGRILVRRRGRKGAGRLRRIALEVDPRASDAFSPLEVDFLALCRKANLPLPQVNVLLEGHLVDFLWPGARVVVETDSYGYHGDRPAFERDHQVDVDLIAAGYDVHRATHRMLTNNPTPFLTNVRRALTHRTASISPLPGLEIDAVRWSRARAAASRRRR